MKGKAVEDSQDARQEVLLPAYRVTGKQEVMTGVAYFESLSQSVFTDQTATARASPCGTKVSVPDPLSLWFTREHEKCVLAGNIFSSPIVL